MGGANDAAGAGTAVDAGRPGSPNAGGAGGEGATAGVADSAGAGAGAAAGAGGAASCPPRFADAFIAHACLHAELGPFVGVAAAPDVAVTAVDRTHTAYAITLPASDAEGAVELRVSQSGAYALFVNAELALVVSNLDAHRSPLMPIHEQDARGCDALERVAVFELIADERYELRIGPGASQVLLILESASDSASFTEACDGDPRPEGGAPDAGECPLASGGCGGGCAELRAACTSASDCCSGRCYARTCVPLECRTDGSCQSDAECCLYCHLTESPHCH